MPTFKVHMPVCYDEMYEVQADSIESVLDNLDSLELSYVGKSDLYEAAGPDGSPVVAKVFVE